MSILILINVSRTPFEVKAILMREFKKRHRLAGICTGGILSIVAIFLQLRLHTVPKKSYFVQFNNIFDAFMSQTVDFWH